MPRFEHIPFRMQRPCNACSYLFMPPVCYKGVQKRHKLDKSSAFQTENTGTKSLQERQGVPAGKQIVFVLFSSQSFTCDNNVLNWFYEKKVITTDCISADCGFLLFVMSVACGGFAVRRYRTIIRDRIQKASATKRKIRQTGTSPSSSKVSLKTKRDVPKIVIFEYILFYYLIIVSEYFFR